MPTAAVYEDILDYAGLQRLVGKRNLLFKQKKKEE